MPPSRKQHTTSSRKYTDRTTLLYVALPGLGTAVVPSIPSQRSSRKRAVFRHDFRRRQLHPVIVHAVASAIQQLSFSNVEHPRAKLHAKVLEEEVDTMADDGDARVRNVAGQAQ